MEERFYKEQERLDRDEAYMRMALREARITTTKGNVPIGAVLVIDGDIIDGRGNTSTTDDNPSHHAENLMIIKNTPYILDARRADKKVELYSTLEPCLMCWGAAIHTGIHRVVYGCPDPFGGATYIKPSEGWLRDRTPEVYGNVLREESYGMLIDFAKDRQYWRRFHEKLKAEHDKWHD